jgi:HAD superfamily hydrolase (TIGR01450 family)
MISQKKLFIFDLDGVVYRETEPIDSAIQVINRLQQKGKKIAYFTNNSTKTVEEYEQKLSKMGLNIEKSQIFTSSVLAINYLKGLYTNAKVYLIGEQGLKTTLIRAGFQILNDQMPELETAKTIPPTIKADLVIVGLDTAATYAKLRTAMRFIRLGAHYYATNDDQDLPVPEGYSPGAGALVAFLNTCAKQNPRKIFGKPYPEGFQGILTAYKISAEDTLMVGDRLETDITGGNQSKIDTLCVGTGIASREECARAKGLMIPKYFYSDLEEMWKKEFGSKN